MSFDVAFTELVGLEGNYSNDENDPGNWTGGKVGVGKLLGTKYGISAAAYPDKDIINLTVAQAKSIYFTDFWVKLQCDAFPQEVGIALFKEAVNMGKEGAVKQLQKALKLEADGIVGQVTIGCATRIPEKEVVLLFLTQCAYAYTQMENFKIDGKGWVSRVIKTALEAACPA